MSKKEKINFETGELIDSADLLNQVIIKQTVRPNGSIRYQYDYSNCPTLAEQHTAHLTDINYLIEKYKPDELAAYIAARSQYRREIIGHDFSQEPDMLGAKNIIYQSQQEFEKLPDKIKHSFKNHLEFLKFIDNPRNAEKMVELGIISRKQIEKIQIPEPNTAVQNDAKDARSKDAKDK